MASILDFTMSKNIGAFAVICATIFAKKKRRLFQPGQNKFASVIIIERVFSFAVVGRVFAN